MSGNRRIKDTPPLERPREKALYFGISHLKDDEVLAIIIGQGTKDENALLLANRLLNKHYSLASMLTFLDHTPFMVKGIGEVKALQILAAFEVVRRLNNTGSNRETKLYDQTIVAQFYQQKLQTLTKEKLFLLLLNRRNIIIGEREIVTGFSDSLTFDVRDILRELMVSGAARFVLIHNHPSGSPYPSRDDEFATERIMKMTKDFGFKFVDHLIIAGDDYFSFKTSFKW